MLAQVKTKSNYRNLNGVFLPVKEISGKRVSCVVYVEEIDRNITVDFTLSEIMQFQQCPVTFK